MRYDAAVDVMLAVHEQTAKAYLVSDDGDEGRAVWLAKRWALKGDALGGFERMDRNCQRKLVTIYEFTVPAFKARDLGLAA